MKIIHIPFVIIAGIIIFFALPLIWIHCLFDKSIDFNKIVETV